MENEQIYQIWKYRKFGERKRKTAIPVILRFPDGSIIDDTNDLIEIIDVATSDTLLASLNYSKPFDYTKQ